MLNSAMAVEMSVFVVRASVRLRQILASNRQRAAKLNELERKRTSFHFRKPSLRMPENSMI